MKNTTENTLKVLNLILAALSKTGIKNPGDKIQKRAIKLAKEVVKAIEELDKKTSKITRKNAKATKKSNAGCVKKRLDKMKNKKTPSAPKPFHKKHSDPEIKKESPFPSKTKPGAVSKKTSGNRKLNS